MATLQYNGVRLEMVKTLTYEVTPYTDPTGLDLLGTRIVLDVEGVWSEYAIGNAKPSGYFLSTAAGTLGDPMKHWGQAGDRLGISLYNLRERLMTPRQPLYYWIGNDLVVLSPMLKADNATLFQCDLKGGPFPDRKTTVMIIGDKTAWVRFRVETYVSNCSRYLLSTRWETTERHDDKGFSERIYRGQAIFRKDFLLDEGLVADDFRKWLILPVEPKMRRMPVEVVVNREGTEVAYTVHDRETNYGTGAASMIAKIDCNVTSGAEGSVKSVRDAAKEATSLIGNAFNMVFGDRIGGAKAMGSQLFNLMTPHTTLAGICCVTGQAGADRYYLVRVAHAVLADRLNKGPLLPVAMYIHVDWSSENPPYVELSAEYMGPMYLIPGLNRREDVTSPLNWRETITGQPVMNLNYGPDTPRTKLPGGNNTRGAHVGRIVGQILALTTCGGPGVPLAPGEGERGFDARNTDSINGNAPGNG